MVNNRRWELQDKLEAILGSPYVYFQPDENTDMVYPCIVYTKTSPSVRHADNKAYLKTDCYELTFINEDPDTEIPDRLLEEFPMIHSNKRYIADGMYHDPFVLYY